MSPHGDAFCWVLMLLQPWEPLRAPAQGHGALSVCHLLTKQPGEISAPKSAAPQEFQGLQGAQEEFDSLIQRKNLLNNCIPEASAHLAQMDSLELSLQGAQHAEVGLELLIGGTFIDMKIHFLDTAFGFCRSRETACAKST